MTDCGEVIVWLYERRNTKNIEGMKRFAITGGEVVGVSVSDLRAYAKNIGKEHELAKELWDTHIHEAMVLASMLAEPKLADEELLEKWVHEFCSWDICDQACKNFVAHCEGTKERAKRWCESDEEFVRRAGFVLICEMAVHHKDMRDEEFLPYLDFIRAYATDERNFVKKAVNWALREVGKRRVLVSGEFLALADELSGSENKTARWIGRDAAKEIREKLGM